MSRAAPSYCVDCGAGCCTHIARALDAKDARIAELTRERDEARMMAIEECAARFGSVRAALTRERDRALAERDAAVTREELGVTAKELLLERDEARRERDEARRQLVSALMAGDWPGTLGTERAEADRRWPGSGEALFPCAQVDTAGDSADAPPPR